MICKKCGATLNEGSSFCSNCGQMVDDNYTLNQELSSNSLNNIDLQNNSIINNQNMNSTVSPMNNQTLNYNMGYSGQPQQKNNNNNNKMLKYIVIGGLILMLIGIGVYLMNKNSSNETAVGNDQSGGKETNNTENNTGNNNSNISSFAGQERDSTLENPLKMNEVAKLMIHNLTLFSESQSNGAVYIRASKKVSNDQALNDLREFNKKYEGTIYAKEEKLDQFEWHEVIFDIDYKDYPTQDVGDWLNVLPTFTLQKDYSEGLPAMMECFSIQMFERVHQGDVVQFKVLYQWPIGRNKPEILKAYKENGKSSLGYQYFLIEE